MRNVLVDLALESEAAMTLGMRLAQAFEHDAPRWSGLEAHSDARGRDSGSASANPWWLRPWRSGRQRLCGVQRHGAPAA